VLHGSRWRWRNSSGHWPCTLCCLSTLLVSGKAAFAKHNNEDHEQQSGKPATPRTDMVPTDGYVLSVDGKLKAKFETSEAAMAAGLKLKQTYPVLQVQVFDAGARSYTPVPVSRSGAITRRVDSSGRLLFRAPFPALWSAPAPAQAQAWVREYRRGSGPFRGCRLVSNRADVLSCRPLLQ